MVDANTRLACVFGSPLRHTLSPAIHNAAINALGINACYHAFELDKEAFISVLPSLKSLKVAGFNLTMPLKEVILPYCELSNSAKEIGAVNTVVVKADEFYGHNTDWYGFSKSLEILIQEPLTSMRQFEILLLGSGGAAKAVLYSLNRIGAEHVNVFSRNQEKAREICRQFVGSPLSNCDGMNFDLIINATPVGMDGISSPISDNFTAKYVLDLIYNPPRTPLLKLADAKGCRTENGLNMLIYQAKRAFELIFKTTPSIEEMFDAAKLSIHNSFADGQPS